MRETRTSGVWRLQREKKSRNRGGLTWKENKSLRKKRKGLERLWRGPQERHVKEQLQKLDRKRKRLPLRKRANRRNDLLFRELLPRHRKGLQMRLRRAEKPRKMQKRQLLKRKSCCRSKGKGCS
ncbi:hypothetical protein HPP92_010410 [Vanilla planifolia]|uniref:Uncharacterized protein n=1 Tax=Vanilla planifolia TaxID=51239 RepID=A0A835R417_VANPL|nr:hypothetical protein HPP92_010702 [Vanilla planifolia]KAG0482326.1 hypothetical protein HPP92_010410 [Vanilla planifolia]